VGKVCAYRFSSKSLAYYVCLTDLGTQHYIGLPIQVYPLYENAFRAFRNQSIEDNNNESGHLYGEFARVAEKNPIAWNFGKPAASEADIKTVSQKNRMICYPCIFCSQ
jgi:hypothetical protein